MASWHHFIHGLFCCLRYCGVNQVRLWQLIVVSCVVKHFDQCLWSCFLMQDTGQPNTFRCPVFAPYNIVDKILDHTGDFSLCVSFLSFRHYVFIFRGSKRLAPSNIDQMNMKRPSGIHAIISSSLYSVLPSHDSWLWRHFASTTIRSSRTYMGLMVIFCQTKDLITHI